MAFDDDGRVANDRPSSKGEEPSLARTRSRRTTAGNQMAALLDVESQDDLALLFAEDEHDEEFSLKDTTGDADDVDMSSSDSEDEAVSDQLEGEKELQKRTREETRKKRKKQDTFNLDALRKRMRIEPKNTQNVPAAPNPSLKVPKKRPERVSFVAPAADAPVRSSSRRLTLANKELTHARLRDNEEKRVRLIATLEKAAQRKDKSKEKVMTQADRLAEAERVERLNSKSLNRWEEMERKRAEEQREKLLALQNRRLNGAVLTYWSGKATWRNGNLTQVGRATVKQKNARPPSGHVKENEKERAVNKDADARISMDDPVVSGNIQVLIPRSKSVADIDAPGERPTSQRSKSDTEIPTLELSSSQDLLAAFQPRAPNPPKGMSVSDNASLKTIELPTRPNTAVSKESSQPKPLQSSDQIHEWSKHGFQGLNDHAQAPVPSQSQSVAQSFHQVPQSSANDSKRELPVPTVHAPHNEVPSRVASTSILPSVAAHSRRHTPITPVVSAAERESFYQYTANSTHGGIDNLKPSLDSEPVSISAQGQPRSTTTVTSVEDVIPNAQHIEASLEQNASPSLRVTQVQPLTTAASTPRPTIVPAQVETPCYATSSSAAHPQPLSQAEDACQQAADDTTKDTPELQQTPQMTETTSRNVFIAADFESLPPEKRSEFHVLVPPATTGVSRKASKASAKPKLPTTPLCPITSRPATYRDPVTNLPYASAMAYKELRDTISGRFQWVASRGFECFCGPTGVAAKGVPKRFLDENATAEDENVSHE